ncbi:MAG: hypothetical protein V4481_05110 [Patescibacteria group bacterium]
MNEPLQPVPGSWDVQIEWKAGTTDEERDGAQSFINHVSEEANDKESEIPDCVTGVTIRKVQ